MLILLSASIFKLAVYIFIFAKRFIPLNMFSGFGRCVSSR